MTPQGFPAGGATARQNEWSWPVAIYFALSSAGAGAYLVWRVGGLGDASFAASARAGAAIGIALQLIGALFVLADLGRRARFYRAGARPGASWESRAFFLIVACAGLGVAQIAAWMAGSDWADAVSWPLAAASAGMLAYGALLLRSMRAYPLWRDRLQLVLYPAGGLLGGCGVLAVDPFATWDTGHRIGIAVAIAALCATTGGLLAALVLRMRREGGAGLASAEALVRGRHAVLTWGAVVGLGLVAAFALAIGSIRGGALVLKLAGGCALAGLIAQRYVLLVAAHKPATLTFRGAGPWGTRP
jgi:formate-dependent nitrite reductase membrane component NrfD